MSEKELNLLFTSWGFVRVQLNWWTRKVGKSRATLNDIELFIVPHEKKSNKYMWVYSEAGVLTEKISVETALDLITDDIKSEVLFNLDLFV